MIGHLRKAAVAAAMGLLLSAVSASAMDIAWVHANAAAQSEQRVKAGFDAWLKEKGKDWKVSLLDSGGSGERTASNLQDAASRGVDAIVITMADLRASRAAIDAAVAAKIPIFTADSGYIDGVIVDVTTNNWAMSSSVSPYLLNELGGKGNIIFLRMAEHHGTRKRGDVMETILKEYPDVKVLAEHNIDYTAFFEDTTSTMQDYAARFGDQINAVWAPWDEPAQAAINALSAAGLKNVKVIGIDGHPNAVAEVCKDNSLMIATVSQPFEKMGGQLGDWIEAIVEKKEDAATVIPSKTVYMDAPLVTKQNCKDFLPK
ncbi:sugar ABC transporter substrate-binding protein [Ensifer soli]|uniref:sugar ABC transporter substrate-binding protein n=1 Tax=Ciceribacter sp. sgz301302 TaxID=3342379 RepID=UPI0035BAE6F8